MQRGIPHQPGPAHVRGHLCPQVVRVWCGEVDLLKGGDLIGRLANGRAIHRHADPRQRVVLQHSPAALQHVEAALHAVEVALGNNGLRGLCAARHSADDSHLNHRKHHHADERHVARPAAQRDQRAQRNADHHPSEGEAALA